MADVFSKEQRSAVMRRVLGTNTAPERVVRSVIHKLGFRFRLRPKPLPGRPDVVLTRHRAVIFVHGCFWHGHACARGNRVPKQNHAYWVAKIARNKARDVICQRVLKTVGWRTLVLWECELKDRIRLAARIQRFLKGPKAPKL